MQETPEPDATSQESAGINNNNKNHSSSNEDVQMTTTATSEDGADAGEMKPDLIGDLTNLNNERNASGVSDVADVKATEAPDSPPERAPLRRPFAAGTGADGAVEKGEIDVQMKEQADSTE